MLKFMRIGVVAWAGVCVAVLAFGIVTMSRLPTLEQIMGVPLPEGTRQFEQLAQALTFIVAFLLWALLWFLPTATMGVIAYVFGAREA